MCSATRRGLPGADAETTHGCVGSSSHRLLNDATEADNSHGDKFEWMQLGTRAERATSCNTRRNQDCQV